MDRIIQTADKEWLDQHEAAAWLNVKPEIFAKAVKAGKVPPGKKWSAKTVKWRWSVLWAVSILVDTGFIELPVESE